MDPRKYDKKEGTKRYGIRYGDWRCPNYRFFSTSSDRDRELKEMEKAVRREGIAILRISAYEAEIMRQCLAIVPDPARILEIVKASSVRTETAYKFPLSDAIKEYLEDSEAKGQCADNISHKRRTFQELSAFLPDGIQFSSVLPSQAKEFIRTRPACAAKTLLHCIRRCKALYNWGIEQGFVNDNPFSKVPEPKVVGCEVEFLSVSDAERLLRAAITTPEYMEAIPYLALGLFAGIRSMESVRIGIEQINFDQRGITITASNSKTDQRNYLDGHEPVLWDWLEYARDHGGIGGFSINKRRWEYLRTGLSALAGVDMPHNALRHSFCTYHVALHGDAGRTATLLTHRGRVGILYNHYKGNATKADGVEYFGLTPSAACGSVMPSEVDRNNT